MATGTARSTDPQPPRPWLPLLAFVVLGCVLLAGIVPHWGNAGAKDWNPMTGQLQAEVTTLLRFGQFPLWNPWRNGGQPSFAQPESMFLTPALPLALVVGALPALKLLVLALFVIGCLGLHRLAGDLGLNGMPRLVVPLVFYGSSVYPLYVAGGLPNWLFGLALLPWMLSCLHRAAGDNRYVPLVGLLWAGLLFCGDIFHFAFAPVLLGLWALALALQRRSARPLLALAAALLVGACLASVKVGPLLDVYETYPRRLVAQDRYLSGSMLLRSLVDPRLPDVSTIGGSFVPDDGRPVYWIDSGAFVGPLVLAVAALGAIARARRALGAVLVAVAFAWMALGAGASPSLWNLLHRLPVLESMQAPERLMGYVAFALAILAGFGAEALCPPRPGRAASALVLGALVLPLAWVNAPISRVAFSVPPTPELPAFGDFHQAEIPQRAGTWGAEQIENVLTNRGNTLGTADVPIRTGAVADTDPLYRGEVWLLGAHGRVTAARVTPNVVTLSADLDAPDRLMLNQNFFPGWRAAGTVEGWLERHDDLLSLPLPAGHHELTLHYGQQRLLRGVLMTLATLAVIAAWFGAHRRHAAAPFAAHDAWSLLACAAILSALALPGSLPAEPARPTPPPPPTPRKLVVDPAAGPPAFASIQDAIAAAGPEDVILIRPGTYDGFRLDKGASLAAALPGSVTVHGPCTIEHVPRGQSARIIGLSPEPGGPGPALSVRDCEGTVFLQSLRLGLDSAATGPALRVDWAERLHLFDVAVGLPDARGGIAVSHASLVASNCELRDGVVADHALLLLNATSVHGEPGAPALRLAHTRLVSASDTGAVLGVAAPADSSVPATPALLLVDGSTALLSGTTLAGAPPSCDATSRWQRAEPPLPRVVVRARPAERELDIEAFAPPGSRAFLLLGDDTVCFAERNGSNLLQARVAAPQFGIPLEFDATGSTRTTQRMPPGQFAPGRGWFAQVAIDREPGSYDMQFSLLDGALFVPGQP